MPSTLGIVASHRVAPAALPSPVGWWDASNDASFTYVTGNQVSQWADLSGGNHHATCVNASWPATRVAAAINGLPAVDPHPGSLNTSLSSNLKPVTIIAAVKTGAATGGLPVLGVNYGETTVGVLSWDHSVGHMRLLRGNVALIGQATSPFTANTPTILGVSWDASDVWAHHRDGVAVGTGTTGGTFTAAHLGIGAGSAPNGAQWDGMFGELLIYNRALSTVERQQVETYLRTKWGTP